MAEPKTELQRLFDKLDVAMGRRWTLRRRMCGDYMAYPTDEDVLKAMEYGAPKPSDTMEGAIQNALVAMRDFLANRSADAEENARAARDRLADTQRAIETL